MNQITYSCPSCGDIFPAPFTGTCSSCGMKTTHPTGPSRSVHGEGKWHEHTTLCHSDELDLGNRPWHASFAVSGTAEIEPLVRFAISYGYRTKIQATHGSSSTDLIICFVPEILGTGTAVDSVSRVPVSGICIMNSSSPDYGQYSLSCVNGFGLSLALKTPSAPDVDNHCQLAFPSVTPATQVGEATGGTGSSLIWLGRRGQTPATGLPKEPNEHPRDDEAGASGAIKLR
jgi:hypothetical protein